MTTYYFHGGTPFLNVGDLVLPPSVTAARSTTLEIQLEESPDVIAQRPDKVYLTTDVGLAEVYAGLWTPDGTDTPGGGSIYQVEVQDGSMEPDADLLSIDGLSFQADCAVVVAVHKRTVATNQRKSSKKLKKVMRQHERLKAAAPMKPSDDVKINSEVSGPQQPQPG